MHEEFKRIMQFFSLGHQEKAEQLEAVFHDSVEFFERFRYTLERGSPEEKKLILEEFAQMQDTLQEEMQRLQESTGLTPRELDAIANDPNNFKEDQWKVIQDARHKIEREAQEISDFIQPSNNKAQDEGAVSSPSPSKKRKKKKWHKT